MSAKNLIKDLKVTQTKASAAVTADAVSTGVDMTGYNALFFHVVLGATGDTLDGSNYIDLEIQHSPDNSTWTAATDAMLSDSVTGTTTGTFARVDSGDEDSLTYSVGVVDPTQYRYWRVNINVTGTHTNGTPAAVIAVQGSPDTLPAA